MLTRPGMGLTLAFAQFQPDRIAIGVDHRMDFGRQSAARAPHASGCSDVPRCGEVGVLRPPFDVRGVLMHPDGGGRDHLKVAALSLRHRYENRGPNPDFPPADEPVVTGRGRAIALWVISPRRTSSKTPIDAVDHLAVIRARRPSACSVTATK